MSIIGFRDGRLFQRPNKHLDIFIKKMHVHKNIIPRSKNIPVLRDILQKLLRLYDEIRTFFEHSEK